jgi:hypothetical protein
VPNIQWTGLPQALRDHLFERLRERKISIDDLYQLEAGVPRSSGNVFRDLGFPPGKAEHLLVRADLMIRLEKELQSLGLKQAQGRQAPRDQPTASQRVAARPRRALQRRCSHRHAGSPGNQGPARRLDAQEGRLEWKKLGGPRAIQEAE